VHRVRPVLDARHPVHVVMRGMPWLELRTRDLYRAVRRTMARYLGRAEFRIVHMSIQQNHLHLVVEAADRAALTRNMQSFTINCARAINAARNGGGSVFVHRYHATQVRTKVQAHDVVSYVLNNWRKHAADDLQHPSDPVDPYSSGVTFHHWSERVVPRLAADYVPLPTSPPETVLLSSVRHIDPFANPAIH
jgi:REP element-mobilizing transposase RayT